MTQKLDEYIDEFYVKNLWFVKYKGKIIYNSSGVRGYVNKGAAKSSILNTIIEMVKYNTTSIYYVSLNKCNIVAEMFNIPEEEIRALSTKLSYLDDKVIILKDLRKYLKDTYFKELLKNKIIEFVKL